MPTHVTSAVAIPKSDGVPTLHCFCICAALKVIRRTRSIKGSVDVGHYYSGTKITQSSAGSKYTHDSSGMARNVTSHRLREYVAPSGASCVSNRQVGGCAQWSVLFAASHAGVVARRRVAPPPPAAAAAARRT